MNLSYPVTLKSYAGGQVGVFLPMCPKQSPPVRTRSRRWIALKLGIHEAMCEQGVTQVQLSDQFGIDGRQVRRILDPDHESKLSQLEAALAVLGLRASVNVTKVSAAATSMAN